MRACRRRENVSKVKMTDVYGNKFTLGLKSSGRHHHKGDEQFSQVRGNEYHSNIGTPSALSRCRST